MRIFFLTITLMALVGYGCRTNDKKNATLQREVFNCSGGEMKQAGFEEGKDTAIPVLGQFENRFQVLADTNFVVPDYVSNGEKFIRQMIGEKREHPVWKQPTEKGCRRLSAKEKKELEKDELESIRLFEHEADSIHLANNQHPIKVWVINNTNDTVITPMEALLAGCYICVLQAQTKNGDWRPVQYFKFATCGNASYDKYFPPRTANPFVANLPSKGDYATRLRFKLLGNKTFYYSNEINGRINYCAFVEDRSTFTTHRGGGLRPEYQLDTLLPFHPQ